ncbi:MAG: flavodoxin domain-containing protein [Candidatus Omnitrophica bacterium]|nr:flavodoxin domain-containing protein [Candidatus Omnitrophota bacterium]MDD5352958.1 flavodoxin domain-containing protein [Candidatus Omnitrophota bacterium]MDD5550557.1 flavodoxin domain-containing protein [Candidatus Omnitrophota bacterium]
MSALKVIPDVYWVGAVDWNVRNFHGHTYSTSRGTTYNAYLIIDDKVALVDTVYGPFAAEMIENIKQIIVPEKIDYIIANHVETDHSGALPAILKLCPKAKVFGTAKCKEGLDKHYYGNWDFQVVKTGDKLKLGKKTLTFNEAPMLHWPDSMFSYLIEDQILLPNDAFGQHYATNQRFDDEVDGYALMEEAAKYYGNILWPLSPLVLKKIQELIKANIPIKIIAPSHGIIWRKDPMKIVNAYLSWAKNETKPKVAVIYETMWQATEKMARKIVEGITDAGLNVKLFDVTQSDRTEIIKEMLDSKGYIIGSSTHDNDMLPNMAGFLHFLKGLKPKERIAAVFGSYGWAGGAVKNIEDTLKEAGIEIAQPSLSVRYVPDGNELKSCYEYGKSFARIINK